MAVDVDGSFANPVMQVAVYVWALVLATAFTFVFLRLESRKQRIGTGIAVAAFGCVSSPFANRLLGMWFYQVTAKPGVNVGFIGSPPFWLSPLFALAITGVVAIVVGKVSAPVASR